MNVEILSVGPFEVNCAIVWGGAKQALVIDPGLDAADIEAVLRGNGLTVAAYLLTHGHADHLCALDELHAARPSPVYIHAEDFKWAFGAQNQIPPYYPVPGKPATEFIHPETSKDLKIADLSFQTLETPGHTKGCVCYYFEEEKVIFTGDTLFKGTCGRTDLPGGDGRILAQSLKKLAALPGDVTVYPGHNESTTIGYEKKTNFFMQQAAK
ncbi:MAG: MBL fold metallo-hydrolase [Kiritimatiellales bacterium]|jgi:glyoxylase-like metal-dependent hydrolase (beta-lactamase superfamily II)